MGDNNLTIAGAGRPWPSSVDGDSPLDPPGFADKKRLQQQDMQVLLDKTPLFDHPLAISTKASGQELALGWNPFASATSIRSAAHAPLAAAPAPPDPSVYTDDALRHDLAAYSTPDRSPWSEQLAQRRQALEQPGLEARGSIRGRQAAQAPSNYDGRLRRRQPHARASQSASGPSSRAGRPAVLLAEGRGVRLRRASGRAGDRASEALRLDGRGPGAICGHGYRGAGGGGRQAGGCLGDRRQVDGGHRRADPEPKLAAAEVAASSIARGESVDASTVARVQLAQAIGGLRGKPCRRPG